MSKQKWRYRVVSLRDVASGSQHMIPLLHSEGEEGWELVLIWSNPNPRDGGPEAIFRQPDEPS